MLEKKSQEAVSPIPELSHYQVSESSQNKYCQKKHEHSLKIHVIANFCLFYQSKKNRKHVNFKSNLSMYLLLYVLTTQRTRAI